MKKAVVTLAVLLAASALPNTVRAHHWGCDPCYIMHCVAYEPRTVTCYKPEWREEKVNVVVQKMQCKEVVDKVKIKVLVPTWEDQQYNYNVCRYEPATVLRDVVKCHYVACCAFDPCTGCPIMTYRPVTCVEKVACTVLVPKTEVHTKTVTVCKMVCQEQVVDQRRTEWFCVPETTTVVRRYCVQVPYQTVVHVPVRVQCCGH